MHARDPVSLIPRISPRACRYTDDPFTALTPDTVFNISRFLLNDLFKEQASGHSHFPLPTPLPTPHPTPTCPTRNAHV